MISVPVALARADRASPRPPQPDRIGRMRLSLVAGSFLLFGSLCAGPAGAVLGSSDLAGTADPFPHPRADALRNSSWARGPVQAPARTARVSHEAIRQASVALLGQTEREDRAARVNPGVAFLLSALVPGAGQLAEGRNRGFAYVGVEALSWIARYSWIDAGNKKEGEYEAYARRHWEYTAWDSLASESNPNCEALPPNVSYATARDNLLGFLEVKNYQHYYEDIGKLEAYRAGWDDFSCADPGSISPNRAHYRGMREDSNNYLDRARNALTVIFLNHIVSAVDAYRTAKGVRMGLPGGAEIKFRVGGSLREPNLGLRVTRKW